MQKKMARLLLFVFAFVIFGASLWQVYLIRDGKLCRLLFARK